MPYRIRVHSEAKRDLQRLPGHVRQRVIRLIGQLAQDRRPQGSLELRDRPGVFRIRVDRYRLIYLVDDDTAVVGVLRARLTTGPETYEDLPE